jgi:hypothetical protein
MYGHARPTTTKWRFEKERWTSQHSPPPNSSASSGDGTCWTHSHGWSAGESSADQSQSPNAAALTSTLPRKLKKLDDPSTRASCEAISATKGSRGVPTSCDQCALHRHACAPPSSNHTSIEGGGVPQQTATIQLEHTRPNHHLPTVPTQCILKRCAPHSYVRSSKGVAMHPAHSSVDQGIQTGMRVNLHLEEVEVKIGFVRVSLLKLDCSLLSISDRLS